MLSSEIRPQILQVCCQCDKRLCRKNCVVYISFILILIACVDGLTGFPEAISAVYPKTEVQQCIIHQIRNSTRYVSYKDIKALMADLKKGLRRRRRGNGALRIRAVCDQMGLEIS